MNEENFKETEIGLIPEDWDFVKLEKLINIKHGFAFKGEYFSDEETPNILLTPGNFKIGGGFNDSKFKYYNGEIPEDYVLNEGDIIVSMTDLSKEGDTLGYSAKIPFLEGKKFLHNQRLGLIIPISEEAYPDFIYWKLRDRNYRHWVLASASGTTVKHTSPSRILGFEFALPPRNEQKKIASFLSVLDYKIELNHKMNQTLEAIGQAIFRHWFVHFEFPDEEGRPYKSSDGEMVDSELGQIPVGWEVQEIGKVIETTGGGTPSTKKEEYWEKGDIQWFSPRDITANNQIFITESEKKINDSGLKNSSARIFPPHSLMMTSRATVGELSINTTEACTNQGFITCIPNEILSIFYLYFWIKMNKENIISLASGSTFREINKSTFRSLKILIPDKNIIKLYNKLINPLFSQIESNQTQNIKLSKIRDSLLPKLMSGKIRIKPPKEATIK